MPVALEQAIRYASGTRLRFERAPTAPLLHEAIRRYCPGESWLAELRTAPLQVIAVESDGCVLSLQAHGFDARVSIDRATDGSLRVAVVVASAGRPPWTWERAGLVVMLGGKRDVYLAQRTDAGLVPALRLRYNDGSAHISLLGPAIAGRLDPVLRAFAPDEIALGTLAPEAPDVEPH